MSARMATFAIGLVTGWGLVWLVGCNPGSNPANDGRWLGAGNVDTFVQLEAHLRGMDMTMTEIGYRYTELYFAGTDRNWDYADYQLEKLDHTLRLGLERRPNRAQSAQEFLDSDLPAVAQLVRQREPAAFDEAMVRLTAACMKCHVLEEVPHFAVEYPEHRLAPIRMTAPTPSSGGGQ